MCMCNCVISEEMSGWSEAQLPFGLEKIYLIHRNPINQEALEKVYVQIWLRLLKEQYMLAQICSSDGKISDCMSSLMLGTAGGHCPEWYSYIRVCKKIDGHRKTNQNCQLDGTFVPQGNEKQYPGSERLWSNGVIGYGTHLESTEYFCKWQILLGGQRMQTVHKYTTVLQTGEKWYE